MQVQICMAYMKISKYAQVAPGSMWEGGLRIHVELQTSTKAQLENREQDQESSELRQEQTEQGPRARDWLPLVHALANGAAPAVMLRLPPKPELVPSRWAAGERVEVTSYSLPAFAMQCKHDSAIVWGKTQCNIGTSKICQL